eukprot:6465365-Amphidinium_carterae.1
MCPALLGLSSVAIEAYCTSPDSLFVPLRVQPLICLELFGFSALFASSPERQSAGAVHRKPTTFENGGHKEQAD